MASEQKIREVLNLLTAPRFQLESIDAPAAVHTRNMRKMIRSANIVALGISEKITLGEPAGKLSLTFYVQKKVPLSRLMADEAIPPTVPEAISGPNAIPTDVVVLGKIRPEANVVRKPIQPGNSIGHIEMPGGTLGAIVTDGKDLFVLSNSHVLARNGNAKKGDPVIYPGRKDGGRNPSDIIGLLHDFIPFIKGTDYINEVDAAIARIDKERLSQVVAMIKGGALASKVVKPRRGMKVVKVGRTSGKTTGEIRDVDIRVPVPYGEGIGEIYFTNQVLCTRFTEAGDSGSLVMEEGTSNVVGLHFCGAPAGSIFNPIDKVLKALGVRLAHNGIKKMHTAAKKAAIKI